MTTKLSLTDVDVVYRQYSKPLDALREYLFRKKQHQDFYALKQVSFELKQGQALGLIGDNGAGKSTLLKVLAGNLPVSNGSLDIDGRVSAILELGGGFHPAFSGYENARLGLSLLGVPASKIEAFLQKVIDFAELGDFIRQPVRTYSSGMLVRLAFSVAIMVEPDILVVDEALSVGDQYFQKKSLDYMRTMLAADTTLIFCSHNLYQIKEMCTQALWLEAGRIKQSGDVNSVVDAYQNASRQRFAKPHEEQKKSVDVSKPHIQDISLNQTEYKTHDRFVVKAIINPVGKTEDVHLGIVIRRNDDIQCYGISTLHDQIKLENIAEDKLPIDFIIDELPLLSGEYCLEVWLIDNSGVHVYDARERCCYFSVMQSSQEQGIGVSVIPHRWEQTHVE
jgi:lipopolysaccharide transport system ATP-binding protein